MATLKKISDYIIYGNLLISLAAVALIWESYMLFGLPVNQLYLVIGFAATLFTYNIDRIIAPSSDPASGSERHKWIALHRRFMLIGTKISGLFLAGSLFYLSVYGILFLVHLGIISIAYSVPVLSKNRKSLRSIKFLKIFLITYVWAASTVIMPAISAGIPIMQRNIQFLFAERCLFIFALALPFDMRDFDNDKAHNVITIPGLIGITGSRNLAYLCLIGFFILNFLHYNIHSGFLWAKLGSGIVAFVIILFANARRHEYYYTGLLDSMMILQCVLVVLFGNMTFF